MLFSTAATRLRTHNCLVVLNPDETTEIALDIFYEPSKDQMSIIDWAVDSIVIQNLETNHQDVLSYSDLDTFKARLILELCQAPSNRRYIESTLQDDLDHERNQ